MLAWKLNSISFPKHNSYKLEDPWQALSRERKVYVNPMIKSEQVSSEKKTYKGFSRLFSKGLSGYISHNTESSRQKKKTNKNLLNILDGLFKLSFFIFIEEPYKVGVVMTEDWTQIPSDLFQLWMSLGSHHP